MSMLARVCETESAATACSDLHVRPHSVDSTLHDEQDHYPARSPSLLLDFAATRSILTHALTGLYADDT